MAKTVIGLEVNMNSSGAEGSVKSLKAQLREAQAEVVAMADKFGATSIQAAEAAKKAAELKDRIGDAKALTDAFNPDKKFQAFSSALSGVAGGFAAVQGAMALMGSESQDVEKALLKVQSAMALAQGLSAVTESIDAFKNLGTVLKGLPIIQKAITAAQWLWNAAMAANPIGAMVAVVAALIAGIVALTKYFISNAAAAKQQAKAVEDSAKALDKEAKTLERNNEQFNKAQKYKLDLAKASGLSTAAIRALELKLIDEKIAFEKSARATAYSTYEKEKNRLASLKAADADDDLIKKQQENVKKSEEQVNNQNKNVQSALDERIDIQRRHTVEVAQEQTTAYNKSLQAANDFREKERERIKTANEEKKRKEEEHQKELADLIKKRNENKIAQDKATDDLILRNSIQSIKDSFSKSQQEIEINRQVEIDKQLEAYSQGLLSQEQYNQNRLLIDQYYNEQQKTILDQHNIELADKKKKSDEEKAALDKKAKDDEIAREKAVAEQKKAIQDASFGVLDAGIGFLKEVSGKNKAFQKAVVITENAVGIAKQIIANQIANAGALATPQAIASGGASAVPVILRNNIRTALGIATTVAATAKALSAIGSGGSAGGGGNLPGAGGTAAPIGAQMGGTALQQAQINATGNAAVQAFVLESDVSGNQERIERLNRAARIQ